MRNTVHQLLGERMLPSRQIWVRIRRPGLRIPMTFKICRKLHFWQNFHEDPIRFLRAPWNASAD